ncbi:hypothetical protein CBS101457_001643 [Exobasidium rhododendri]|nr:hypothetical protein CBS101457_001643 [Exobasidium rhododendri]
MSTTARKSEDGSHVDHGRGLASPPYEQSQSSPQFFPPDYRSQTDLNSMNGDVSSDDKGKQRTPPESTDLVSEGLPSHARTTATAKGPRIAVMDPLAELRLHNASRPKETGPRSDYPPRLTIDPPTPREQSFFNRRNSDASSMEDEGDLFDEFDWSEDEEERKMASEEVKQVQAIALRRKKLSPFSIIKWLATTFLGNLIISATLIVPVIVIQVVYRPQTVDSDANAAHRDYVADNIQAWFIWAAFNLHVEWWIHLSVELFPRSAAVVIKMFWGGISQKELTFVEFYNAFKKYIKMVYYAALAWGSWAIIFNSIYNLYTRSNPDTESRAKYLYRIYQVIEFFFFFTLTICAEKMLVKAISIRFHQTAYSERIAKVTKALKVFDQLKDYRPKLSERSGTASPFGIRLGGGVGGVRTAASGKTPMAEAVSEGQVSGTVTPKQKLSGKGRTHAHKRPMEDASGTATPSGMSTKSGRTASATRAVRSKATQASTLAKVAMIDPTNLLTDKTVGVGLDVNSPTQARRLARSIFRAFRGRHHRNYLIPSDFNVAYSNPEDAREAFETFDDDRNGDISVTEMKNTIVETYKERRFISKSLEDTSHALGQLDIIFLCVALIILIFEGFAIFKVDIGKSLTTIYTLAIGASFIFKESAQNIFDSIIFIFVTHPFDTGDRIVVDGAVMVVQKMSLLSSQFLLWDNTQIFISNSMLSQMFITNYRRSGYQWECVTIQVAFETPLAQLDAVQEDLIHWLQTEPERMFEPSTAIVPQTIDFMRSITVTIGMTHRANYQDWGARWYRRNAFFAAVCYYMRKHGVKYMNSNQPILYWDPPSYESTEAGPADTEERVEDEEGEGEEQLNTPLEVPGIMPENDNFTALEGGGHSAGGAESTVKQRSFMNFTPPVDELQGSQLRKRKARNLRGGMTQQGGDG